MPLYAPLYAEDDMYRIDVPVEKMTVLFADSHQIDDTRARILSDTYGSHKRRKMLPAKHDLQYWSEPASQKYGTITISSESDMTPSVRIPNSRKRKSPSSRKDVMHPVALHPEAIVEDRVRWHNPDQLGSSTPYLSTDTPGCEARPDTSVARDVGWDVEG
jgi:hypothetical protein